MKDVTMFKSRAKAAISKRDYPGQRVLHVDFDFASLGDWALSLLLLQEHLVRAVRLSDPKSGLHLHLELLADDADVVRGTAKWQSNGLHASMTTSELRAWLEFFLLAYRDRQGRVDHIDVEFRPVPGVSDSADLTLRIPWAPPIPSKEARKLLGLD